MCAWTIAQKNNLKWMKAAYNKLWRKPASDRVRRGRQRLGEAIMKAQKAIGGGYNKRYAWRAKSRGYYWDPTARRYKYRLRSFVRPFSR